MVPSRFPEPSTQWPVEIFAMMEPAREVGGDLYDFFEIGEGLLCFLVGDVSGKGVSFRAFHGTREERDPFARPPGFDLRTARLRRRPTSLAAVNRELAQDNLGMMFVTLFFGLIERQKRRGAVHQRRAQPAVFLE